MKSYEWRPIEDLPEDWQSLADLEFPSLVEVWKDYRESFSPRAIEEFSERLKREWSIETGIIEDVYRLDRNLTETLIERGIDAALIPHDASPLGEEHVAQTIEDHEETLEGIFAFVKGERELSTSYIKELHQQLLKHQDTYVARDPSGERFNKKLEKGVYKTLRNSPSSKDRAAVHEYCPPEHTGYEMDRLVDLHRGQVVRGVSADLQATWLHHAFTQIHPFQDGNGRVARALATIVFIRSGMFPLVVQREGKPEYIDSLREADDGDLRSLIGLLCRSQREALLSAAAGATRERSNLVQNVRVLSVEDAISATKERLIENGDFPVEAHEPAIGTSLRLRDVGYIRLAEVAEGFGSGSAEARNFFSSGRLRTFRKSDHNVIALQLRGSIDAVLSIKFESATVAFSGLVTLTGDLQIRGTRSFDERLGQFLVNYSESQEVAERRFRPWMEQVIIAGLNEWRKLL